MQTETLGEKIARLRREKQMTQAQLAAIMHVTDKAVSKWECDGAYPDITSLPLLAGSLGVSVDQLLSKTTDVKKTFNLKKFLGASSHQALCSDVNLGMWKSCIFRRKICHGSGNISDT